MKLIIYSPETGFTIFYVSDSWRKNGSGGGTLWILANSVSFEISVFLPRLWIFEKSWGSNGWHRLHWFDLKESAVIYIPLKSARCFRNLHFRKMPKDFQKIDVSAVKMLTMKREQDRQPSQCTPHPFHNLHWTRLQILKFNFSKSCQIRPTLFRFRV